MLSGMRPGSVVLDMAANANTGGNVAGSVAGTKTVHACASFAAFLSAILHSILFTSFELYEKFMFGSYTGLKSSKTPLVFLFINSLD